MIDTRCFENGHIKNEAFIMLEHEELDTDTRIALSGHLASCNICSQNYITFLTDDSLLEVSDELNEEIIKSIDKIPVRVKSNRITPAQLLKLTTAAVLAISLYSAGFFNYFYNTSYKISSNVQHYEQLTRSDNFSLSQRLNNEFSKFSDKFDKINNYNGVDLYEKK